MTCENDNPVATDDAASGTEDTDVVIQGDDLTANDSDVDGDALSVSAVSNPTGGTVDLTAGVVTFTPDANLCGDGAAGFDYTVDDGNGGTDTGHVTIDLECVNDAPVAVDDSASGTEDTDVVVTDGDLLANDTDTEGDALSVTGVSNPTGGTVDLTGGVVTFTPDADLCGDGAAGFDYDDLRRQRRHRHGPRHRSTSSASTTPRWPSTTRPPRPRTPPSRSPTATSWPTTPTPRATPSPSPASPAPPAAASRSTPARSPSRPTRTCAATARAGSTTPSATAPTPTPAT